jgi:hypothetical protein
MARLGHPEREQFSKRVICTVCGIPWDSFRIHATTCSEKCRKQRSRWLKKIEAEAAAAAAAAKAKAKKKKKKKKPLGKKRLKVG